MPQIHPNFAEGFVLLDRDRVAVRRFTVSEEHVGGDPGVSVKLEFEVDEAGRPRCIGVEARAYDGGDPITAQALRIPIGRLGSRAMRAPMIVTRLGEILEGGGLKLVAPTRAEREDIYAQYREGARRPRRGSPITDENLRAVAELYRRALSEGDPPTKTVCEEFHVQRATASRWIAKARERGLLGPASPGRAGER